MVLMNKTVDIIEKKRFGTFILRKWIITVGPVTNVLYEFKIWRIRFMIGRTQ